MRRGPAPSNLDVVVDWNRYVAGADIAEVSEEAPLAPALPCSVTQPARVAATSVTPPPARLSFWPQRTAAGTAGPWDPAHGFVSNADYVGVEGTYGGPRGGGGGMGGLRGVRVHPSNDGAGGAAAEAPEAGISGACDPAGPADTRVYDCGGT